MYSFFGHGSGERKIAKTTNGGVAFEGEGNAGVGSYLALRVRITASSGC